MTAKKNADKTSSQQNTDKPIKTKKKTVKVEKLKLKTPPIKKLEIPSPNKHSCKPPNKITVKEANAIDAAARKLELANEVAMAQFQRLNKTTETENFLVQFTSPLPVEAKPLKLKIKIPKNPSENSDKPKKGRPKKTKIVVSEFFETSTPADEKPKGGDPNNEVQPVISNSPPKKRIPKKKVIPDCFEELKKKSTKRSTTTKKIPKPKIPKSNKKKTDCASKPRARKVFKVKDKLSPVSATNGELHDDNKKKTVTSNNNKNTQKQKNSSSKCPRPQSRETSISSECLSWANDISSSSNASCLLFDTNFVKLNNKVPIVQLTSIENFFKNDDDKCRSDSNDSLTKCSLTSSKADSVTQSLHLSRSSSSSSSSSTTTPSDSPNKESNLENLDPTKLIDFDFIEKLAQGNFELNQRDIALINNPAWAKAETEIMQCCQDLKIILCSGFLIDDVKEDIAPEPKKRTFERSAKNLEAAAQNAEKITEANVMTNYNNAKKEANNEATHTENNSNIDNNIDDNIDTAEMNFEHESCNYQQDMIALETELAKAMNYTNEACVPNLETYGPLQTTNNKSDFVSKQITYDPLKRTIINDMNGQNNIEKDYDRSEKDAQGFENFKDRVESPENVDKSGWYWQHNNKDYTHAQKEALDSTNEDACQSPVQNDEKGEYRQPNFLVTDDDDVLSLMAESLSGIEPAIMTNSTCAKPSDVKEYIPHQTPRPLMSINCNPFINEINGQKSLPIEFNREVNFENSQIKNTNFQQTIFENPVQQHQQNFAENQVQFQKQRPMLLATMYKMPSGTKCHFLRGVCYFNLTSNCRRLQCKFPHRNVDAAEGLSRMSNCDNRSLIQDYLMIRGSPELRRKYGHCFACEFERRKITRVLVEMVIDFTIHARPDSSEDYNLRMVITEKALKHLNEVDLSTCADLLVYVMSGNNYLLCDKLMEELAETQNFSRFKLVFLKLTDFMVGIYRTFSLPAASQILERVCILPCDPSLIRAMWAIVMNTDDRIFKSPHLQQFENLVCNEQELYQRFLSKKQQVIDRETVTGVPMSRDGGPNLVVMQQEKHYMSATPDMDDLQMKDKRSLDDQPQNLKPPQVQKVIRKALYTFAAPKISNFKIPSLSSRQKSIEYRSPLQANGQFNYRGNQRNVYQQSMTKGAYNKGSTKFLRRAGARSSDY